MRYLLMFAAEETAVPESSAQGMSPEYETYIGDLVQRGVLQGGERLRPSADATTVRVRNGEVLTTDGPFAETKEQLGGYFLVDCKDLDEALELAAKNPGALNGAIEVRPIWEM
jgi:hypothetical protein